MSLSLVNCSNCNKNFLKDNRHVNENKKLGHNFYCSYKCQYLNKNKQVELICENHNCNNKFKRTPSKKSFRNFCSRRCAMTVIGPQNGLKHKKYRYCNYCGKSISENKSYCSPKCWGLDHKITKKQLIKRLQQSALELKRSPTKREFNSSSSCQKQFGSWTNALIAAGLAPHRSLNQRMYKRRKCVAKDGHICNSVSELIIDNWLFKNNIAHQKEVAYPKGKFTADWSLANNIFIEYFGLAQDSRRYDEEIKKKQQICKDSEVTLIEIYSKDLFPKNNLSQIFQKI